MSSDKINLEEILLQNHFHILDTLKNVYSPDTHNKNMYERLMNGINDICKQVLELATENGQVEEIWRGETNLIDNKVTIDDESYVIVNKQSILDTIKQIE